MGSGCRRLLRMRERRFRFLLRLFSRLMRSDGLHFNRRVRDGGLRLGVDRVRMLGNRRRRFVRLARVLDVVRLDVRSVFVPCLVLVRVCLVSVAFSARNGMRLGRLHKAGRRQRRRGRLDRLWRLLRERRLLALLDRRFRENVAGRQRDVPLLCKTVDELSRHDLFDRARRALHLDAVIALQQRRHFLARGPEKLRNLVNPDSCQRFTSTQFNIRSSYSALSP
jgi:hypothetical protein